jgi:TIR domain-containing protein
VAESDVSSQEQVAQLVRLCLEEGHSVEIDGLGIFHRDDAGCYQFVPRAQPKIFLGYAAEDLPLVDRLFATLEENGFAPWLDRRKLLPGQNWPRAIEQAIETSDFFVACFSHLSVRKKGSFQSEVRYALDCAQRVPLDETYLIPVRLDECRVPWKIRREIQYIDLFPDWNRGVRRVLSVMEKQLRKRR